MTASSQSMWREECRFPPGWPSLLSAIRELPFIGVAFEKEFVQCCHWKFLVPSAFPLRLRDNEGSPLQRDPEQSRLSFCYFAFEDDHNNPPHLVNRGSSPLESVSSFLFTKSGH